MKPVLETERLLLREFTLQDTGFIMELLNSPGWLKYIGDRNVKTEEQALAYLQNGPIASYRKHGFGLSLVQTKGENLKIGMCGVLKRDNLHLPDIGFAFLPQYNGKGYAYEIASATLTHAKEHLKIPLIAAITTNNNQKSIQLLEKTGFNFIKIFNFENDLEKLLLYEKQL